MEDRKYLRLAIEQAKGSVEQGGFPAGAILVKEGKILVKAVSLGFKLNDPTSHAETFSIREACKNLRTVNLSGATLYASLQPCLMCFSVANWAGVGKIVFGCRKTKEMVKKGYYEGENDIYAINEKNNRKIELVYLPDFEKEVLGIINNWEKNS